jgi:hypothetical protein
MASEYNTLRAGRRVFQLILEAKYIHAQVKKTINLINIYIVDQGIYLNMETIHMDGHCLFQSFCPFVKVELIQNNVEIIVMERNITKYTWEKYEYLVITPT